MEQIKKILSKLGLSKREIQVYLTGLGMGPSLASEISKKTKIGRSLVYHLLELLRQKGLVSSIGPKHGRRFEMEPPTRLKAILARQKRETERTEKQLDNISTELESIYSPKLKQARIRFYEGVEGMKNVVEDTLTSKEKKEYVIASVDNAFEIFDKQYAKNYFQEHDKRKIFRKSIWSKTIEESGISKSPYREQRVVPQDFIFPSTIFTYDNKVAVFSSANEETAFIIESEEFAKTMKAIFKQLWKISK